MRIVGRWPDLRGAGGPPFPRTGTMAAMDRLDSLLDIIDQGESRYGERFAFGMRGDDGSTEHWTYRELNRRSRIVAWRLRALGLQPGDRLLIWTPSSPAVPAVYFGAMRAGVALVPLDLRMSTGAIERIVARADARHLVLGTGRDTPDPADACLERFPTSIVEDLAAEPDGTFPADWEAQVNGWPRPQASDIAEIVFTSGTTGEPKGVMLTHANLIGTLEAAHNVLPEQEHRCVSLLPLSHLLEQVTLVFYAMSVGAHVLYVRSRNPRVIFEAIRDHRTTTLVLVPQIVDLFWAAIETEVARQGKLTSFNRLRRVARRLPYPVRRRIFARVHRQFGGSLNLLVSAAAFLPPALQQAWEDLGVVVMQGYGATECGPASATSKGDHGLGTVGRTIPPVQVKLADDGEILVNGPTLFGGYWRDPGHDRRRVHGRRLVPDRRHRPPRRLGPPDPDGPDEGHHRPAQRPQRLSRGHRERAPDRPASATPWWSRRGPAGSRRWCWRPAHRCSPSPANRRRPPAPPEIGDPVRGAGGDRGRRPSRQRHAGGPPARRRLAALAGRRLPADAHAQGQARPGPRLGGRRRAAAGP